MFSLIARLISARVRVARPSRSRKLTIESFERRHALAGIVCDTILPPDVPILPDPPAEQAVASTTATTTTNPAPYTPPNNYASPSGVLVPPTESEQNLPPVIESFTATRDFPINGRSEWTISGQVSDDHLLQGVTVIFAGLADGHNTQVDIETGLFVYYLMIPPNSTGNISAFAVDSSFAQSPIRSVFVP